MSFLRTGFAPALASAASCAVALIAGAAALDAAARPAASMPQDGVWLEIFNSDSTVYGGSGKGNLGEVMTRMEGDRVIAELTLPPLATMMFTPA